MAQEPFFPGPFKLPGSVGKQTDRAHCPFCGMTFIAKVEYVRSHVGGVTGVGVAVCKGVARRPAEGDEELAERTALYVSAKASMVAKIAAMKEAADSAGE